MGKNSILTHSNDFFADLIFSSWSLINKGNNLYVSIYVKGPFKIKFNQGLYLTNPLLLGYQKIDYPMSVRGQL